MKVTHLLLIFKKNSISPWIIVVISKINTNNQGQDQVERVCLWEGGVQTSLQKCQHYKFFSKYVILKLKDNAQKFTETKISCKRNFLFLV